MPLGIYMLKVVEWFEALEVLGVCGVRYLVQNANIFFCGLLLVSEVAVKFVISETELIILKLFILGI